MARVLNAAIVQALAQPEVEVQALLELETGSGTEYLSTQVTSWDHNTYEARLLAPPTVRVNAGDPSRGVIGSAQLTARIANADGHYSTQPPGFLQGRSATVKWVIPTVTAATIRTAEFMITQPGMRPGGTELTLQGEDWFGAYRRQKWPSNSLTLVESAFPGMLPGHAWLGRTVPIQIGRLIHPVPLEVDANRTPEHTFTNPAIPTVHHFLTGFYAQGGHPGSPLMVPHLDTFADVASTGLSLPYPVGSTGLQANYTFAHQLTPLVDIVGPGNAYTRAHGLPYDRMEADDPPGVSTGLADAWSPVEVAALMTISSSFGLVPVSKVDSAHLWNTVHESYDLGGALGSFTVDMRASITDQQPLENWLGQLSHDGALGVVTDGEQLRLRNLVASRAPVHSFHTGNVVAGTLSYDDSRLSTLPNRRTIKYPLASRDLEPKQTQTYDTGSGAEDTRTAWFVRDSISAWRVAQHYAKREEPRLLRWTSTIAAAHVEQYDLVTMTHSLLGSDTINAEVQQATIQGNRIDFVARQSPSNLFTEVDTPDQDLDFSLFMQFINFGQSSWSFPVGGVVFTRTHSLFTAPTHLRQELWNGFDDPGGGAFGVGVHLSSSLSIATNSDFHVYVENQSGIPLDNFQFILHGWLLDTY